MKVVQQINESSFDSYKAFIKALKTNRKGQLQEFCSNSEHEKLY